MLEKAQKKSHTGSHRLRETVDAISKVLWGHDQVVRLALATVLSKGHLLVQDVPGVGKTTLARAMATVLGSTFARIQFTADMLPSDVLGIQILDKDTGEWLLKPGPIMHQIVLADELNRASPKTQSAMLEAMAESAVTIDNERYEIPAPFLVIATQNPMEHHGTYPLPESQLDRFTCQIAIGYPPHDTERALIQEPLLPQRNLQALAPLFNQDELLSLQENTASIQLASSIVDYILSCVERSRTHPDIVLGCSPRAAIACAAMSRAWAMIEGRDFVLVDDVQSVAPYVWAHRIVIAHASGAQTWDVKKDLIEQMLQTIPVPR